MIEIWVCDITTLQDDLINLLVKRLPTAMQKEVFRFQFVKDQKFKLLGRLIVDRYHASKGIDFSFDDWRQHSNKKPFIKKGQKFNISHSGNYVAVAFSDLEVGVDIELEKEIEVNDLIQYFHPDEVSRFESTGKNLSDFYTIWTRKEAYLKAKGVGLIDGLNNNDCMLNPIVDEDTSWHVESLKFMDNYHLAVCSIDEKLPTKLKIFDGKDLLIESK